MEIEETDLKRRKLEYLETTIALKDEYKHLLAKEQNISTTKENMIKEFKSMWKNLNTHGSYKIYAFTVNNKGKYPMVGALAEKGGIINVCYMKGYCKNLCNIPLNTKTKEDGYICVPYNGLEMICLPFGQLFITFNTNGITTYNCFSFVKVENLDFYTDVWKTSKALHELKRRKWK